MRDLQFADDGEVRVAPKFADSSLLRKGNGYV